LFSVRLQCPFAPLARVEQTGTPPGHKREVPVCVACKFRADNFFANGLPVCSRRVARTPPKVTAPAASVGRNRSALRLREWVLIFATWRRRRCPRSDGQCPFASRMQMGKVPFAPIHIYARPQTGSARLWTSAPHSLSSHRRTCRARSFTESRVGTNGHTIVSRRVMRVRKRALRTHRHVHIRKRALRCEEHKRAPAESARLQTGTRHKRDITDEIHVARRATTQPRAAKERRGARRASPGLVWTASSSLAERKR